jgi:nucleotide-binding universal stress UspA family protein
MFAGGVESWEKEEIEDLHAEVVGRLEAGGIATTSLIEQVSPKRLLVDCAEKNDADCIVMGARGRTRFERMMLGSVSSAVAARAHCSVEVVRPVVEA